MRPPGEIRMAIASSLERGPAMTREIAMRSGVGVSAARYTLRNMVHAGEAVVVDRVRVQGVKRPVPRYDLARAEQPCAPTQDWALVDCWAKFPTSQDA